MADKNLLKRHCSIFQASPFLLNFDIIWNDNIGVWAMNSKESDVIGMLAQKSFHRK